jgi:hypothetical protein
MIKKFTLVLDILASQCFFASVTYLVEIIKTSLSSYLYNKYNGQFFHNYAIYIQSTVASLLFLLIGLIIYSIIEYVRTGFCNDKK